MAFVLFPLVHSLGFCHPLSDREAIEVANLLVILCYRITVLRRTDVSR